VSLSASKPATIERLKTSQSCDGFSGFPTSFYEFLGALLSRAVLAGVLGPVLGIFFFFLLPFCSGANPSSALLAFPTRAI
jgi:hypothetical protein